MASQTTLKRIEKLVWIFIYGGMLSVVLGIFLHRTEPGLAFTIQSIGAVFVVAGVVLIYVRSRLKPNSPD